jgi:hypothetical protein
MASPVSGVKKNDPQAIPACIVLAKAAFCPFHITIYFPVAA